MLVVLYILVIMSDNHVGVITETKYQFTSFKKCHRELAIQAETGDEIKGIVRYVSKDFNVDEQWSTVFICEKQEGAVERLKRYKDKF